MTRMAMGGIPEGATVVEADRWRANGTSNEVTCVDDAAAPSGKAWVMKPGRDDYEVACSYPAQMATGHCYRVAFHIQLQQAAGTVVRVGCSGAEHFFFNGNTCGYEGYLPESYNFLMGVFTRDPTNRARLLGPIRR